MSFFGVSQPTDAPPPEPITGTAYLTKLHKYLKVNASRLAPASTSSRTTQPSSSTSASFLQQSYTLLTLGLDPSSAPLSRAVKVPLTLGFGTPSNPRQSAATSSPRRTPTPTVKPLLLRLPPDRLLYLLLRWQSLPQSLPHVGRTDVPIEDGVPVAARGARVDERRAQEGDVKSVMSWVGSMRSVSLGSMVPKEGGRGWFGRKEEINEDQILLALYTMFTILPALLIHPPFVSEPPILDLIEAGGYTQLGGIDVRVPLDVLRNLQILELEGYDPRGLLIPSNPGLRSLTVRDVQDGDDWVEELATLPTEENGSAESPTLKARPRFPNLRHFSLIRTNLLSFPDLPLTSLTHLDLSHNLLNALPPSLSSLSSLVSLNLSNNVIVSLRTAPSCLGNITSLNLSHNRIDCLVGLDRVMGLERVDVRSNELAEEGEVGRLAILPGIREVWCTGNLYDKAGESDEWRIQLGASFREEGKEVILDDTPFTWSENRRIETLLSQRGKLNGGKVWTAEQSHSRSHSHSHETSPRHAPHHDPSTGTRVETTTPHSRQSSNTSQRLSTQPITKSNLASPASSAAVQKKKGRRRVINLDGEDEGEPPSGAGPVAGLEASLRGSLRLPGMVEEDEALEESKKSVAGAGSSVGYGGLALCSDSPVASAGENGTSVKVVSSKRKGNRKGLNKDTFDPIANSNEK
ncbi:hypothetical protein CI109_101492 [Kwoniella shandongensis]|uniref:Uncharacterized protein n=1 Tax=Kwoniella shandongensis TaxID=1734106 RepID=A0A5M6C3X2_9TREE|nr:uncharacterized protein CI109_001916 [Kwoniella shandongensis]KAA5529491.1 hypothetical protein CI109_001916 [Kwoniella shandongensis]